MNKNVNHSNMALSDFAISEAEYHSAHHSTIQNPVIMEKAKRMLLQRKQALSLEIKEKYRSALESFRKKFLQGYVDALRPPL